MSRYQIWDKKSNVITPSGEVFTPEEWMNRYPWISMVETAVPVISAGMFNGGFIGELSEMKLMYENQGAVFDDGLTNEELLAAIEAYEDEKNNVDVDVITPYDRIAAALEYMALCQMEDE